LNRTDDKAGKDYWDKTWSVLQEPELIDATDPSLTNEVNRRLHLFFQRLFSRREVAGKRLLEVGCARSVWLPYFAQMYGLQISGLDYSEDGCRQEEMLLKRAGVEGVVVNADLFQPPTELRHSFDYVITFGVVEHFRDPASCIQALGTYLRTGGILVTLVPNMLGMVGTLQGVFDRDVFEIHVPLDPDGLRHAHEAAGLTVISSDYFLSTDFYVVNIANRRRNALYPIVRLAYAVFGRLSMGVWWLERYLGELRTTRTFSPYVICVAEKRA
jgi:2-polyprenyl-3-methyl-5-hydroxy-6-metoxy-1,4-benzoquinol methylase